MYKELIVKNPIMMQDYPDVDVIRVEDTYYMISTTMHFFPGGVILRSYDLVNWEIASFVYDRLDDTDAQLLSDGNIYGKGMWAASLRYCEGTFYVCFVCNDTHKTYLYKAKDINGPWSKNTIEGFYHDCSLLFDNGRKYIVYGNRDIYLTELNEDMTAPLAGGLHRMIVSDAGNPSLGYEGTHIYKIDGTYYVFFIHSLKDRWYRTEACFMSDSLEGEFVGGDVFMDDMNYRNAGIAQGGIVDTPDGRWYSILFQDRGGIGRVPVLVPVHFDNKKIVFGDNGKMPKEFSVPVLREEYEYESLFTSKFIDSDSDERTLCKPWQWNHTPNDSLWDVKTDADENEVLELTSGKVCNEVVETYNVLTQRMKEPYSEIRVLVDGSTLKVGDYAGISAFMGSYANVAINRENDGYYLVVNGKNPSNRKGNNAGVEEEFFRNKLTDSSVILTIRAYFGGEKDYCEFLYEINGKQYLIEKQHELRFALDHFCGARFGLFIYSTIETGGTVRFSQFSYNTKGGNDL